MSFSLDDIWDDPVLPPASPHFQSKAVDNDPASPTRPSPAKRRRTTLFLSSDSEDGSPSHSRRPAAPSQPVSVPRTPKRPDIEALFDGLDDDDAFGDLAPELNVDQLRREAAAKLPPLAPHALLSSSPPRDLGDKADEGAAAGGKKDKDGEGLHKRKLRPKLDEPRLIGTDGFPALAKQAKHFRPKGKGHEVSDLKRLMQIYQFWSHKMYPNNTFEANVQRIEQLCHTRRMISSLGVWKDEFHGTVHGVNPEDINSDGGESGSESNNEEADAEIPAREVHEDAMSSSPPRPVSSASNHAPAEDDDWDIDAVIREVEERERAAAAASVTATAPAAPPDAASTAAPGPAPAVPHTAAADDEDAAMWDEFGIDDSALLAATQEPPTPAPPAPSSGRMMVDEDEEMWDVVREMEQEQSAQVGTKPNAPAAVSQAGPARQLDEEEQPTNDEGWDEMYL